MSTRAKFTLVSINEMRFSPTSSTKTLHFHTQYDPTIPEDQSFTKATPTGKIEMRVDNPAALEQFVPGEAYYVDFTRASPPTESE